ncbi:MAG: hypothetical protein JXA37_08570 [Chloroflexia bacterium]|nr:hypothetical protein [Chloroflexia bacterium]
MAYMIMLVAENTAQVDAVLEAWESIPVDDVVFVDSTCFHREGAERPHIPMRFVFQPLGGGQRQCSVTLFGIVRDEGMVQQCIEQAETVMGDIASEKNAMLVAWPLCVIKGFSPPADDQGGEAQ